MHTPYTLYSGCTIVDTKLCYHTLFNAPTSSLPTKKLSKINIVFDFLTTEYFLDLACVKCIIAKFPYYSKPITHIIAKFPNYTTLAWVRFELKIPIRINLRTTVRIDRGNLLLVMNNIVLL